MSLKIPNIFLVALFLVLTACPSNKECPSCEVKEKDQNTEICLNQGEDQKEHLREEVQPVPPEEVEPIPPEDVRPVPPEDARPIPPEDARPVPPEDVRPVPPPAAGRGKKVPPQVTVPNGDVPSEITGRRFPPLGINGRPIVDSKQKNALLETEEQNPGECRQDPLEEEQKEVLERGTGKPVSLKWNKLDELKYKFEQLNCQDCPLSFGHLIRKIDLFHDGETHTITKNCQGSLIGEDLFLTARHCLSSSMTPGDSCEENIQVILPGIDENNPMKIMGCDQLVRVSESYQGLSKKNFQPDWAILKLKEKSPGRFLKLNKDDSGGISDNESLFGFLLLESEKTEEISIAKIKCRAVQDSLKLPEFNSNQSPLGLLKCDHPLVPGFSGMTLFRKNEDQQYSPAGSHTHSFGEEMKMSVISQAICMGEGEKPEFCEFDPDKRQDHINKIYEKSLKKSKVEIDKRLEHLIEDESGPIRWQQVNSENWRNLPKPYVSHFNKNIEKFENLGEPVMVSYMQNQVPVYPECVRRSFVPDKGSFKIPVQVPTMEVALIKAEDERIVTYYQIIYLNGELVLGSDDPEERINGFANPEDRKFIINFISQKTSHEYPRNTVGVQGGFSHIIAIIPLCPK